MKYRSGSVVPLQHRLQQHRHHQMTQANMHVMMPMPAPMAATTIMGEKYSRGVGVGVGADVLLSSRGAGVGIKGIPCVPRLLKMRSKSRLRKSDMSAPPVARCLSKVSALWINLANAMSEPFCGKSKGLLGEKGGSREKATKNRKATGPCDFFQWREDQTDPMECPRLPRSPLSTKKKDKQRTTKVSSKVRAMEPLRAPVLPLRGPGSISRAPL